MSSQFKMQLKSLIKRGGMMWMDGAIITVQDIKKQGIHGIEASVVFDWCWLIYYKILVVPQTVILAASTAVFPLLSTSPNE